MPLRLRSLGWFRDSVSPAWVIGMIPTDGFVIPTGSRNLLFAECCRLSVECFPDACSLKPDRCPQRRHLHRRQRRLKPFIPHLQPRTINGLLQRVTGKHAERMRYARFLRRLSNPARNFIDDHVVVRCVPAQQTAETDDRIIFFGFGESAGSRWDFKGAWHTDDLDGFLSHPGTQKTIIGTSKQALCDELIETRDYDTEAKT